MEHLIVVAGPNGSGKTTLALKYKEQYEYEFINADELEKKLEFPGTIKSHLRAGRMFFDILNRKISLQKSLIIESTLSGHYLVRVLKQLKSSGYKITIAYTVLENPALCIERIKDRVKKGGHFVPDEAVIRRFYRSKVNFWSLYRSLADNWTAYFNSGELPEIFALGENNDYVIVNKELMSHFLEGLDAGR